MRGGTWVRELRELARPERLASDVREERFVEHTLQIAIVDVAVVRDVLENHLDDLLAFVAAVRAA